MTNTDILAFIGALTGSFAASSIIWTYLKEKPSLNITFPYEMSNLVFRCSETQDYYKHKYRLVIYARIENTSSLPISIYEFRLKSTYLNSVSNSIVKARGVYMITTDLDQMRIYSLDLEHEQLKLPITLQSYGMAEGFAFFVYDELPNLPPFYLKFEAHTTRGIFSGETTLDFFNGIDSHNVQNISLKPY